MMIRLMRVIEWADRHATVNTAGTSEYSSFVCTIANLLDSRVSSACECAWIAPYGFVREEGCRDHGE